MDIINGYSRARGRVIDFKEILYGYRRINPLHGVDYVLDLFMTYKKYRGRKMTIPVRRHVYIQRPFGPLQIRSIRLSDNADGITYSATASLETDEPSSHSIPEEFINGNQSPATYPRKPTKMVMIVPLSGRFGTFRRFLDSFSEACLEINNVRKRWRVNRKDKVTFKMSDREKEGNDNMDTASSEEISFHPSLIVVFFGTDLEKEKFLQLVKSKREILATLLGNKSSSELQCNIQMVQIDGAFSRGIALETGISQCHENDLLVLIDVDLIFTAHGLRRAHLNTKQNHQVYFPVIFSQYNPDFYEADKSSKSSKSSAENAAGMGMESFLVGNKSSADKLSSQFGYWRDFGYGIAAFYKSDFRSAGGFDTSIKGWGKEDVALFDRFVHHTNLTIFRAPDPDLVHVFHPIECDKSLSHSQYEMCIGSQASTLGSTENLMKHIFYNRGKYTRFQHLFDR
jgi:chondroitin sulfate synthase